MARAFLVLGLCGIFAAGCGSSDEDDGDTELSGDPIDCAWLESDNCWKTTVAAAAACVPPDGETGVLSADGSSCAYASGASVAFHDPLILPMDDNADTYWNFTQSQGGAQCVTFQDDANDSVVLTVQGLTYREKTVGFGVQVTCPDGSQFAADNALELFDCEHFFDGSRAYAWSSSGTSASFTLANGSNGQVSVFSCGR